MLKFITLTLIIGTTISLTYALVQFIEMQTFLFAWVLNFMLMMCVLAFTESLKSQFTSAYYQQKKWERNGKIYEIAGINLFRKALVWVGWEKLNKKANPVTKSTDALLHLHRRTMQSELGHIIIFIIVLGFNVFVAAKFGVRSSLWLMTLNILLNLYPIFLQRYNRPRLERALILIESKSKKNDH